MPDPTCLEALWSGPAYWFRDWPNPTVPKAAAGVYTIWDGDVFVYVGMSGRGLSGEALDQHRAEGAIKGLATRLASHASGRRSGDQFCVYVADRLVLPTLTPGEIAQIAAGTLAFDRRVRDSIHARLSYRFVEVIDGTEAGRLEATLRRGEWAAGKPLLNPS